MLEWWAKFQLAKSTSFRIQCLSRCIPIHASPSNQQFYYVDRLKMKRLASGNIDQRKCWKISEVNSYSGKGFKFEGETQVGHSLGAMIVYKDDINLLLPIFIGGKTGDLVTGIVEQYNQPYWGQFDSLPVKIYGHSGIAFNWRINPQSRANSNSRSESENEIKVVNFAEAIYVFGGFKQDNTYSSELFWWGGHGWNPGGNLKLKRAGHRSGRLTDFL